MCIDPRIMNNGVGVPCRKCWQCKSNTINDWVGRCIAEGKGAAACNAVTLTYGRGDDGEADHVRTAILTYSDVQRYLKRLRRDNFPCRYFVVGEFGGAKGRAHWHILLFWKRESPKHPVGERFEQEHWPHGVSFWEPVNAGTIRYVCKYIQKDLRDAERQRQVNMSKYPPLGDRYFNGLACRYVDQGIVPTVPEYHFPDVKDEFGDTIKFRLRGKSLENFLAAYIREWTARHQGFWPTSKLVDDFHEASVKKDSGFNPEPYRPGGGKPWIDPPPGAEVWFDQPRNAWAYAFNGETRYWSFDDEGRRAWHGVIRTEAQADKLREASARRALLPTYREQSRGT